MWVVRKDVRAESVKVEEQIDASILEGAHTLVMIRCWVDVVDTNGIGSECLHECSIQFALISLGKWVVRSELVRNALDEPLMVGIAKAVVANSRAMNSANIVPWLLRFGENRVMGKTAEPGERLESCVSEVLKRGCKSSVCACPTGCHANAVTPSIQQGSSSLSPEQDQLI